MEELAKGEHPSASLLLRLLDNPPRSLAPLDFLNLLALLVLTGTATWLALESGRLYYLVLALVACFAGRLIFGLLAVGRALGIALASAKFLGLLLAIAGPYLSLWQWLIRKAKGPRPAAGANERVTSDDIQIIVAEGNQERKLDEIEPEEREMIAGIIEMGERTARDLMIPRLDVVAIEAATPLDEALDVAAKYGHSRLPVYRGDIDHIIGVLHVKDLIQVLRHPHTETPLQQLLRPVHYVPDTAKADDLLRDLLRNRVHMAVVVDEYGGTVGLVTIEDALEEIVGEIRDEYDAAEEPEFVRLNENEAVFNGRVPVDEVNDVMSINLPVEESDTLGGLVYTRLGRMAKLNDAVQIGDVELRVTAVTGRRIKKVQVRKIDQATEEAAAAAETDEQQTRR